jgi:Short C-terminal domain
MFGNNRSLEKRLRQGGGKAAKAMLIDAKKGHWVSSSGGSQAQLAASATVNWTLTLRVTPDDEPPFEATVKERFRVGSRPISGPYNVLYDPQDHSKVVITHAQPMSEAERMERQRRLLEKAAAARQQGQAASASPSDGTLAPASHPAASVADELGKLAALRDRGVLTEAEFETQKGKLLSP